MKTYPLFGGQVCASFAQLDREDLADGWATPDILPFEVSKHPLVLGGIKKSRHCPNMGQNCNDG